MKRCTLLERAKFETASTTDYVTHTPTILYISNVDILSLLWTCEGLKMSAAKTVKRVYHRVSSSYATSFLL